MKILLLLLLSGGLSAALHAQTPAKSAVKKPLLRHVVLFKFKDGTTPAHIQAVEKAFAALPAKIKEVKGFEFGTDNSPEGLAQGFTHCFLVTFASEKGRDAYLPHPAHKEFVDKYASVYLDKVCVLDYWAR